jgi:hypothetical protein
MGSQDAPSFTVPLPDEPSPLAFLLQQLGVPVVCFAAVALNEEVCGPFGRSLAGQTAEVLLGGLGAMVSGCALGLLVSLLKPSVASTGKWIWIIPSLFCLWGFLDESLRHSPGAALRMLFFPGPDGEAGWVFALMMIPTIAMASYSAAMAWRACARRRNDQNPAASR